MNLTLTGLRAALDLKEGVARIDEASLSLYGGGLRGGLTARLESPGPPFDARADLSGVSFDGLMTDLSPGLSGILFGTLDASLALSGAGVDPASLRSNLEGTTSFSLVDGKITSVGILKELAEALESAGGRGIGKEETPFSRLGGSFKVRRGKARTEDLRLESPDLSMRGEGSISMDFGIDLDVQARLSPEVSAEMVSRRENLRFLKDSKDRIRVDLRLEGTLAKPKVGIDPEMIRRVIKEAARERIQQLPGDRLKRIPRRKRG